MSETHGDWNARARRGSRYRRVCTVDNVDLTGYGIRYSIAKIEGETPIITLTVGSGITLDSAAAEASQFTILLTGVETAAHPQGEYRHELKLIPAGVEADAWSLAAGSWTLENEVGS